MRVVVAGHGTRVATHAASSRGLDRPSRMPSYRSDGHIAGSMTRGPWTSLKSSRRSARGRQSRSPNGTLEKLCNVMCMRVHEGRDHFDRAFIANAARPSSLVVTRNMHDSSERHASCHETPAAMEAGRSSANVTASARPSRSCRATCNVSRALLLSDLAASTNVACVLL